jgi:signal transduction histidine kinase
MKHSLRGRLVLILLVLTLFAWVTSALLTGAFASRVVLAQVDRQLNQYSDLVGFISEVFARQLEAGVGTTVPWLNPELVDGGDHDSPMIISGAFDASLAPALNIWLDDRLLAVLDNSPRFDQPRQVGFSFRREPDSDSHWRLLTRYDEVNDLWLVVGIELDAARWSMLGILGRALAPLLVILPLTVALVYFGVSRGLQPVRRLAEQIGRRSPQALEPVAAELVPEELRPVTAALNRLLQRLADALYSEQRFTANAAHELRIPLAAIKTEVQLYRRQHGEDDEALARILARVDRATHSVEQLLILARVDPQAPLAAAPVDLPALLAEVLAETGHLAAQRDLQVESGAPAAATVGGNAELLAILLRNLCSNAFTYATPGSTVQASVRRTEAGIALAICNDCEPLSAEELQRVRERFYRVPGSAGTGAGLGLSIVTRIAELHGARLDTGPAAAGRGFCARVVFPAGD